MKHRQKARKSFTGRKTDMKKIGWLLFAILLLACTSALAITGGSTIAGAAEIQLNTSYSDSLAGSSDRNYYKFTLPSAGYVTPRFSHEYIDSSSTYWYLRILNASQGEYLKAPFNGNEMVEKTATSIGLPAGTFYVEIDSLLYSGKEYRFSIDFTPSDVWETEFNNTITAADPIRTNTYYHGTISQGKDKDYYKFTLKNDGCLSVGFKHGFVNSSVTYWKLKILDANQNEYAQIDYDGDETVERTSIHYGLPAGTYYVLVENHLESPKEYSFILNFNASPIWETEFNDAIPYADPVKVNRYYNGTIWKDYDKDYYRFTLKNDGYVSIGFKHSFVNSSSTSWTLRILNVSEGEYAKTEFYGDEAVERTAFRCGLPAGTYYVEVSGILTYGRDYSFILNYKASDAWETEFNDTIPSADPISLNRNYYGTIWQNFDTDCYTFTTPEDGYLKINFRHAYVDSTSDLWRIDVLDAARNNYMTSYYKGNVDTAVLSDSIRLEKGTYYIQVDSYSAFGSDYRLKAVWERETFSIADAVVTVKDQTYTGKALKPAVTVKLYGDKLVNGKDYSVSYRNNTEVGKATVVVTGKGKYSGTVKADFKINPKPVRLASLTPGKTKLTVVWKKGSGITGYEIEYSLKKNFSNAKSVKVTKKATVYTVIRNLKEGRVYYVRVRTYKTVNGKKYYSDWSDVMHKKLKGTAANDAEPEDEFDSPHN